MSHSLVLVAMYHSGRHCLCMSPTMAQCSLEKDLEGGPFSRSGPPSSLSGPGRSASDWSVRCFQEDQEIARSSRQVHSDTTDALAATYNCECLLLWSKEAADTRNANRIVPERPGRGSFLKVRTPF